MRVNRSNKISMLNTIHDYLKANLNLSQYNLTIFKFELQLSDMDNNPVSGSTASFTYSNYSQWFNSQSFLPFFGILAGSSIAILCIMWLVKKNKKPTKKEKVDQQTAQGSKQQAKVPQKISQQKSQQRNLQIKRALVQQQEKQQQSVPIKSTKQLQQTYGSLLFGSIALRPSNSPQHITSIAFRGSQILLTNTKNELILFDMRKWKKEKQNPQRFYTSLQGNTGTALAIGKKHFYVALGFDKTIAIYDFFGGQDGVYFKLFTRFNRNIFASDAKAIYVPEHQQYIANIGTGADTTIQVWNLKGQKLQSLNTYQIDHYSIGLAVHGVLIRGWTSQVKQFLFLEDKQGSFKKLQKSIHLPHKQSPVCSNIDNLGKYVITVNKNKSVNLWNLKSQLKILQKTVSFQDMKISSISGCFLYTIRYENERIKTVIVFTSKTNMVYIADRNLNVIAEFSGIEVKQLSVTGSPKNLVMMSMNNQGKVNVWNLNKYVECIQQEPQNP